VAPAALDKLLSVAGDHTADLGIELRAIRALPAYCPEPCGPGTPVHDGLIAFIDGFPAAQYTPQDLLRLRAAVEALGATRSMLASDVTSWYRCSTMAAAMSARPWSGRSAASAATPRSARSTRTPPTSDHCRSNTRSPRPCKSSVSAVIDRRSGSWFHRVLAHNPAKSFGC
jgi:hypothetical protein